MGEIAVDLGAPHRELGQFLRPLARVALLDGGRHAFHLALDPQSLAFEGERARITVSQDPLDRDDGLSLGGGRSVLEQGVDSIEQEGHPMWHRFSLVSTDYPLPTSDFL